MVTIPHAISRRTTDFVTTSASFVNALTLASSNFVVGRKYLLLVTGQFSMNDSADQYGIRARHGTTVFPGADGTYEPGTVESPQTFAFMAVHTAVSGEDIELQVNSQDGSPITVHLATIVAIEISEELTEGVDWHYNENNTSTAVPAEPTYTTTNNAIITFTPPNAGDTWLIITQALIQGDSGTQEYQMRLKRTGEASENDPQMQQETETPDTPDQILLHVAKALTLGNASNTFENEVTSIDIANGFRLSSAVFALNLSKFKNFVANYTLAGIAIDSTNNFANATEIATADLTPSGTDDVFLFTSFAKNLNEVNGSDAMKARQQFDNVDAPLTQTSDDLDQLDGWDERDQLNWRIPDIIPTPSASLHSVDLDATDLEGDTIFARLALQIELATVSAAVQIFTGVDALLIATQTTTPTVDSLLSKTQTETALIDSIIVQRQTVNPTVDGLVRKETQIVSSVDSLLRLTQQNNITTDSILVGTKLPILVDAKVGTQVDVEVTSTIVNRQTNNVSIDSILVNRNTETITADSILVNRKTEVLTTDSIIVARQTNNVSVDALLSQSQQNNVTVDSNLKILFSANPTVDATLERLVNAQISVDARIDIIKSASITVDALKSFPFLELRTVDAILLAISPPPLAITVDGIIDQAGQVQIFVDPLIIGPLTATANVDATVETPNVQLIATLDGVIVSRPSTNPLIDAKIVIRSIRDALADSILINRKTLPITVDSQVELTSQIPVSADATIELRQTIDSILDSILVNRNTVQSIVDAGLLFEIQKQVAVDSNISTRIPLDVILDSTIILKNIQEPIQVDSLLAQGPTQFLTVDARLLAIQAQIISIDSIILRSARAIVDAKIGVNQIGRTVIVDAHLRIPRRIRTISEIRDNIFSTSIIRRETRSTF